LQRLSKFSQKRYRLFIGNIKKNNFTLNQQEFYLNKNVRNRNRLTKKIN